MLCTGVDDIANKETQQRGKPNLDTRRLEREGTETRSEPSEEKPDKRCARHGIRLLLALIVPRAKSR